MPLARLFAAPPPGIAPVLPALREDEHVPVPGRITFGEFLAGLNPLHHLPVVGTIYRAATGESIQPVMRVIGGGVLGGPVGMLSAAVLAAIDEFRAAGPPRATAEAAEAQRGTG